jgi:hypothetical protein
LTFIILQIPLHPAAAFFTAKEAVFVGARLRNSCIHVANLAAACKVTIK